MATRKGSPSPARGRRKISKGTPQITAAATSSPPTEEEEEEGAGTPGQLYPSVAVSDTANALGHGYAAWHCWREADLLLLLPSAEDSTSPRAGEALLLRAASLGLLTVVLAACVGVLRFGFSDRLFAAANSNLAALAARVGLPLVGIAFAAKASAGAIAPSAVQMLCYVVGCMVVGELGKAAPAKAQEAVKIATGAVLFLLPGIWLAVARQDAGLAAGLALYLIGAVVIGPARHRFLLGMRREDWFHYCIGAASVVMAHRLTADP